ncbi:MAG: N-acetylglucosamine-6-phosphate deacetylase [Clostridiales bacterium]|nr:N-acetylglucosamine-6-phosphate deacetylase [Clostridiales bacterium]
MKTLIKNAKIVTPFRMIQDGYVLVEGGQIAAFGEGALPDAVAGRAADAEAGHAADAKAGRAAEAEAGRVVDAEGRYLAPGFIDLHTHGAGGADFLDGTLDAVCTACRTHMLHGTTSIMPTTLSCPDDELFRIFGVIEEAAGVTENMPEIVGVHLEGPYFSPSQNMAQDARFIKLPEKSEYGHILEKGPMIRRWSIAPELPGALEMGRWLAEKGVIVSAGHTDAVYEDMEAAVENGYTMVTHLYNGMSRLTRKNALQYPGAAESSLCLDDLTVEVIADGRHLPPSLLRLVFKAKGADRICLVTDSMRAAGTDAKESILGSLESGQRVEIEDGVAYMPGRGSFGGSVATTDRLVRTMVKEAGVTLSDAIRMMSLVPARMLGIDGRKGSIGIGKDADIVLFDEDINVDMVMVKGQIWVDRIECDH